MGALGIVANGLEVVRGPRGVRAGECGGGRHAVRRILATWLQAPILRMVQARFGPKRDRCTLDPLDLYGMLATGPAGWVMTIPIETELFIVIIGTRVSSLGRRSNRATVSSVYTCRSLVWRSE